MRNKSPKVSSELWHDSVKTKEYRFAKLDICYYLDANVFWDQTNVAFASEFVAQTNWLIQVEMSQPYLKMLIFCTYLLMELFSSRRWTTGSAQQSNNYGMKPCMCCINFLGLT